MFIRSYLHNEGTWKLSGDTLACHEYRMGRLIPYDALLQQVWRLWGDTVES